MPIVGGEQKCTLSPSPISPPSLLPLHTIMLHTSYLSFHGVQWEGASEIVFTRTRLTSIMGSNRFALYSRFLLSDDREATVFANIERNFLPNPKGTSLGSDAYRDRSIRSYSRLRIWYHY